MGVAKHADAPMATAMMNGRALTLSETAVSTTMGVSTTATALFDRKAVKPEAITTTAINTACGPNEPNPPMMPWAMSSAPLVFSSATPTNSCNRRA